MLSLNTTNKITFSVNVHGTAATPTVRCVFGSAPGWSYPAAAIGDGKYEVLVDLPSSAVEGAMPFKVEVLLNGRLFTPISNMITVAGEVPTPAAAQTPEPVAQEPVSDPAPLAPSIKLVEPTLMKQVFSAQEDKAPKPVAPAAKPPASKPPKSVAPKTPAPAPKQAAPVLANKPAAPTLSGLKTLSQTRPPKRAVPAASPIKVSIAEISAQAERMNPSSAPERVSTAPAVEIRQMVPTSITKNEIIYR